MSVSVGVLPMLIVPLTFLFVLLIILVAKSPKTGAWLVGALVFVAPVLLLIGLRAGLLARGEAIPLVVIPATFLFVLLIILLGKAPKAGAGLIVALVVMGLVGLFFAASVSHRPRAAFQPVMPIPPAVPPVSPSGPGALPQPPAAPSPIWSAGVEQEMDADIYPSKLAAARAAGEQAGKPIREMSSDGNTPPHVVIFQETHEYRLIAELRDAVRRALPEVSCDVEAQSRPAQANELAVTLHVGELDVRPAPWAGPREIAVRRDDALVQYVPTQPGETAAGRGSGLVQYVPAQSGETAVGRGSGLVQYVPAQSSETPMVASGQLDINLSGPTGSVRIPIRFTEKPWLEDFATFASTRPQQAFIIARSLGACTSESEANQQALDDARARLTEAISQQGRWLSDRLPKPQITVTDVLQNGFVVDRFAQGFEATVGKVWRQALLIDVSGPKLAQLANQKAREFRQVKMTWARMGFSAVGVVVLIGVIYFFLNMATRGYYEWSLRIAGVVLAIVAVLSILMVIH
jgi:hypothetical protein